MADTTSRINAYFIIRAKKLINLVPRRYMPVISSDTPGYDLPCIPNVHPIDVLACCHGIPIICSVLVPAVVPTSVVYVLDARTELPTFVPSTVPVPAHTIKDFTEVSIYYTFSRSCKNYILLAKNEFARLEMPELYEWLKGSAEVLGGNRLLVNAGEGGLVVSECPVCWECGVDWTLPCGHVFHRACIADWMGFGNGTCPLCRQDVVV